jgi:uncharacterized protein (DUF1800 family)
MRLRRTQLVVSLLCLIPAYAAPQLLARKKDKPPEATQNERKRALHALNRLTFGFRPGDVPAVLNTGVDKWIDLQLHPDKINDKALETRLAPFRTLCMDVHEILDNFPDQRRAREVMEGKRSMPYDPAQRAVYQVLIARLEEKQERRADGSGTEAASDGNGPHAANRGLSSPPAAGEHTDTPADTNPSADKAGETMGRADSSGSAAAAEGNPSTAHGDHTDHSNAVPAPDNHAAGVSAEMKPTPGQDAEARNRENRLYADLKVQQLIDLPPHQRFKQVLEMSQQEQRGLADSLRGEKGQEFLEGMDPKQKETLLAMSAPLMIVGEELAEAKLMRAIYSDRQLEEVMTDFWFNHFNVFIGKGADRFLVTGYERDVIRPHVLDKFEDLLVATAKSPAMLFFLDNWMSVGPNSLVANGVPARPMRPYGPYRRRYPGRFPPPRRYPNARSKRNRGLNENYSRELMELHTLSVNRGYSQRDVTEVAKVFTGWTIDKPEEGGGFRFDPRMHEPGSKFVLGHKIKDKGEGEGYEVLHLLATSPQTAHFISLQLAQRFVADDPPDALVDRMAKTFLKKKGDIREVLSTLFHSPEFWADGAYRAKIKTPLEFVASAVRATGVDVTDAMQLTRQLNNMGMALYGMQPPTGYSMKAETWVNSSALLGRMNFAIALSSGKVRGVKVDSTQLMRNGSSPADSTQALAALENALLAGDVSKQTHDSIAARLEDPKISQRKVDGPLRPADITTIAALLLGSPEFQRR